jgi:hypothetical protein
VGLAVTQKCPSFAYQHEHRIALVSTGGAWEVDDEPPAFLWVRMPRRLEFARIVSVQLATP